MIRRTWVGIISQPEKLSNASRNTISSRIQPDKRSGSLSNSKKGLTLSVRVGDGWLTDREFDSSYATLSLLAVMWPSAGFVDRGQDERSASPESTYLVAFSGDCMLDACSNPCCV